MTITNQNADIYRGDTALLEVSLTDANGDPFVLGAGGTLKYRIATSDYATQGDGILVEKELNAGILLQDSVAEIALSKEDTNLDAGIYFHSLKVYDSGGNDVATAMVGNLIVRRSLNMIDTDEGDAQVGVESGLSADGSVV